MYHIQPNSFLFLFIMVRSSARWIASPCHVPTVRPLGVNRSLCHISSVSIQSGLPEDQAYELFLPELKERKNSLYACSISNNIYAHSIQTISALCPITLPAHQSDSLRPTHLPTLLLRNLFARLHPIQLDQPTQYLSSSFPFPRSLEFGVPSHEIGKERVKLIFGAKGEFEGVHEGDE